MILRRVVIPLVAAYLVFVGVALSALRRTVHPRSGAIRGGTQGRSLVRHVLLTSVGGYASFLLIVLVFHVVIAGQRQALASAAGGGGFLVLVAVPVFLVLSAVFERRRR